MLFEDVVGASGIAAACARPLTIDAPTSATAEPVRKLRRESMVLSFQLIAARSACVSDDCAIEPAQASAAKHSDGKIGVSQPEIALGFDARHLGRCIVPRCFEQRESVDLHGVILQLRLLGDGLAKR